MKTSDTHPTSASATQSAGEGNAVRALSAWSAWRWSDRVLPAAVFVGMAWWSWGKWPDLFIDFGRELYVPWQISEGKALGKDIAYLNGPLSPYVNACAFRLFGTGLRTLVILNLCILAALCALLRHLFRWAGGRLCGFLTVLVFLLLFAFAQYGPVGNFNYVCPYSHEMTHGLALALAAIVCLERWLRARSVLWAGVCGLAQGLAFLTKAEVFLAGAAAVICGFALDFRLGDVPGRRRRAAAGSLAGGFLLAPVGAWALLCLRLPPGEALGATLGTWRRLLAGSVTALDYYRWGMGTSDALGSLARMAAWSAAYCVVLGLAAALALALREGSRYRPSAPWAVFGAMAIALAAWRGAVPWFDALLPMPVGLAALGVLTAFELRRADHSSPQLRRLYILRLVLIVFSFVLLGKILLNARLYHYGFVLAMPGALVMVATAAIWIPEWIARRGGAGSAFRAVSLAVLAMMVAVHLRIDASWFGSRSQAVGRGADRFYADARGQAVNVLLRYLAEDAAKEGTLVVFPEGVMLNYLARRENPTPHINFMPPELAVFGEEAILTALREHPPDLVALVHRPTPEYGLEFFGRDYGRELSRWIEENYAGEALIGAPPLRDERFGVQLLRRKPSP